MEYVIATGNGKVVLEVQKELKNGIFILLDI
jgi:hypothetical protein